jgi:hypothetical protein
MATEIDPELLAIYQGSDYRVEGPAGQSFIMRIHQHCPELEALMKQEKVHTAAFLSAWNPRSEPRTEEENEEAQARLAQDVAALGLAIRQGMGEDPGGQCTGEPCLLALGISREDAERLGRRYGQNAILWMLADGVPQLLLLR